MEIETKRTRPLSELSDVELMELILEGTEAVVDAILFPEDKQRLRQQNTRSCNNWSELGPLRPTPRSRDEAGANGVPEANFKLGQSGNPAGRPHGFVFARSNTVHRLCGLNLVSRPRAVGMKKVGIVASSGVKLNLRHRRCGRRFRLRPCHIRPDHAQHQRAGQTAGQFPTIHLECGRISQLTPLGLPKDQLSRLAKTSPLLGSLRPLATWRA